MKTIIIANQKGGVGKTTTAVTLAHGLALGGRHVLLVDLDSQGNVADSLGLDAGCDLSDWLDPDNSHPFSQVVTSSGRDRLDVIRSDKRTANLKRSLAALDFGVYVLAEAITQVDGYDVTVLDSAPSVDMLHTAALLAADLLIIPTRLDQLSVKGIRELLQSLTTLQGSGRATCELAGVLPTFYDRVTRESFEQLAHLAKSFSDRILPPIPLDTQCRVATRYGKTLWEHNPDTRALVGVPNNSDLNVGGYTQVLQRLEDEL